LLFTGVLGGPLWAMMQTKSAPETFIQELDAQLKAQPPVVVLLGNSVAKEAIDKPYLSAGLSLERDQARSIMIGGSSAGHWYATLRTRIFEKGYRPEVVIIYSPFSQWRTDSGAPVGADLATLVSLAETDDPVLQEKIFSDDVLAWKMAQLAQRRTRIRNRIINSWNHGLVGYVLGSEKQGTVVARGRQVVEDAQREMGQKRREGGGGALLIVENADTKPAPVLGRAGSQMVGQQIDIQSTILPELISLCRSYGARVVLVSPPIRPSDQIPDHFAVYDQLMTEAVKAGADVLDMRRVILPNESFATMHHLIPAMRKQMTERLTMALKDNGLDQPANSNASRWVKVE
jgi:hypothetical protein